MDAAPEFAEFIPFLQDVWRSGNLYTAVDTPANIDIGGVLTPTYFDFEYRPVKDNNGQTYAIINTATDVTERRAARTALEEKEQREQALNEELRAANEELVSLNEEMAASSEELVSANEEYAVVNDDMHKAQEEAEAERQVLRQFIMQTPAAIAINAGDDFIFEFINPAYEKMIPGEQVMNLPLMVAFPALKDTAVERGIIRTYRTGEPFDMAELLYPMHDEKGILKDRYFTFKYLPKRNKDGQIDGVYTLAFDVTEPVSARRQLEQAYSEISLARQAAQLGTFNFDLKNNVLVWDERCRELFGITESCAIGYEKDFVEGLHPEDRERVTTLINNLFTDLSLEGDYDTDYRTIGAADGLIRWVRAKGKVYFDKENRPERFIGMVLDITEQKRDEQRKNDFIGMVSHEMKTPLTSLSGYLQLMKIKAAAEDTFFAGMIDKANKQTDRITALINGFLNVSRLESGKMQIDKTRFDMAELVKEAEEEAHTTINSHKAIFAPVTTTWVHADKDKISQVISNLLSNAVKYSSVDTEIHIDCLTINGFATISVRDEGIGIKTEDQPKLFDRYYRVNNSITTASGFGIGLYLCYEIIQQHNGKIWVESKPGKGSTFYFTLPLAVA